MIVMVLTVLLVVYVLRQQCMRYREFARMGSAFTHFFNFFFYKTLLGIFSIRRSVFGGVARMYG